MLIKPLVSGRSRKRVSIKELATVGATLTEPRGINRYIAISHDSLDFPSAICQKAGSPRSSLPLPPSPSPLDPVVLFSVSVSPTSSSARRVATVSNKLAALYFANDRIVNHNYCERSLRSSTVSFFGFLRSVFRPRAMLPRCSSLLTR